MTEIGEGVAPPMMSMPEESGDPSVIPRFMVEECYCGDKVLLVVACNNMSSSGGGCDIAVKKHSDNSVLIGWCERIHAGAARKMWVTQKPDNQWPDPEFYLEATAEGVTARSENNLTIQKYSNYRHQTRRWRCSSGRFGWDAAFDIKMVSREIIVRVKIKLVNRLGAKPAARTDPLPAIGSPVSAADKANLKSNIESKLSEKRIFHRDRCNRGDSCNCPLSHGCCKLKIKVIIDFVESGQHHTVNLFQGAGRANSSSWTRTPTRANSYAHETGHLLGWYDEYAAGAVGTAPRWSVRAGGIMASGLTARPEYYWDFRDWIAGKTGESWDVLPP